MSSVDSVEETRTASTSRNPSAPTPLGRVGR
ncbi:hypothetical protein M6B38_152535 [Iris pallida]|uniref:Photosystem II phosphoprotein n=1 Tax=Iris pallida TaxID=29817 RepID=A0AAX6F6W8_IRIPA|nr:hypothetical protein M6B38_152535 [Iris pallida]